MKRDDFETEKELSLSHQVIKLGRLLNEKGLASVRERFGVEEIKQSHLDLFPHIDFEGTSVSVIAQRKGVTKQAVSKLVQEMVQMGALYFKADPEDSRSKLVCFQTKGPFAIHKGFKALMDIDVELKKLLGERKYRATLLSLGHLVESFQRD